MPLPVIGHTAGCNRRRNRRTSGDTVCCSRWPAPASGTRWISQAGYFASFFIQFTDTTVAFTQYNPDRMPLVSTVRGQTLEGSDVGEIKAKTQALEEASHKLAEAVYAAASAQAQSASSGDGVHESADEEVVEEADYEVIDKDEAAKKS